MALQEGFMKAYTISTKLSSTAREKRKNKISSHFQLKKQAVIFDTVRNHSTDYSPLFFSFLNLSNISRGRGLCKFNNSLISNTNFVDEMEILIQKVFFSLENDTCLTDQVKWELLKYEIRKFAINVSRKLTQISRKLQTELETKIENLEQNKTNEDRFNDYKTTKVKLENF